MRLVRFPLLSAVAPLARALIQANAARAQLTAEQTRSSSLSQLRSFNGRVRAASAADRTKMPDQDEGRSQGSWLVTQG